MGTKPTDFTVLLQAALTTNTLFFSQDGSTAYKVELGAIRGYVLTHDFNPTIPATDIPSAILQTWTAAQNAAVLQNAAQTSFSPGMSGLVATDVQNAIVELKTLFDGLSFSGNAVDVTYNPAGTGLSATDVQAAITELKTLIDALPPIVTDAVDINYDPAGTGLSATDVQAAITELKVLIDDFEFSGAADQVSYDPSLSGLSALNVQDAIDQVAVQFTDYPMVKNSLGSGDTLTVPSGKQLIVFQSFTNEGVLTLLGDLVILPEG